LAIINRDETTNLVFERQRDANKVTWGAADDATSSSDCQWTKRIRELFARLTHAGCEHTVLTTRVRCKENKKARKSNVFQYSCSTKSHVSQKWTFERGVAGPASAEFSWHDEKTSKQSSKDMVVIVHRCCCRPLALPAAPWAHAPVPPVAWIINNRHSSKENKYLRHSLALHNNGRLRLCHYWHRRRLGCDGLQQKQTETTKKESLKKPDQQQTFAQGE
jgi:hypothetical protein